LVHHSTRRAGVRDWKG